MTAWLSLAAWAAPADVYVCPTGDGFDRCCRGAPAGLPCVDGVQAGLDAAPDGGVVEVGPGAYPDAVIVARDVTLRGRGSGNAPILSTADPKARAVVEVVGDATVVLEDLLVASVATRAVEARFGGDVTLRGCTVLPAGPRDLGGAIRVDRGGLRLERTLVDGGTAETHGGQIYADGASVTLVDSQFFGGTAVRRGGALYARGASTVEVDGCLFSGSTAYQDGGAIAFDEGSDATVRGSTFLDGVSLRDGGAIWAGGASDVRITDTRFLRNSAVRAGGALAVDEAGLSLDRSELSLNRAVGSAGGGGALWLHASDPAFDRTWSNDRFVENAATDEGGAVRVTTAGRVALVHATLLGNAAAEGGALAARGTGAFALEGSVVAFTAVGAGVSDPNGLARAAGSVWFANTGGDWLPAAVPPAAAGNVVGADPLFFSYSRDGDLLNDDLGYHPAQSPLAGAAGGEPDPDGSPADAGDAGGPGAEARAWNDPDGDGWPGVSDCNDGDADVHPGAPEADDGIDSDCDGSDGVDLDRDGFDAALDCDDHDATVFPGAPEDASLAVDRDCDGWTGLRRAVAPAGCDHVGGGGAALLLALTARRRSASSRGR